MGTSTSSTAYLISNTNTNILFEKTEILFEVAVKIKILRIVMDTGH